MSTGHMPRVRTTKRYAASVGHEVYKLQKSKKRVKPPVLVHGNVACQRRDRLTIEAVIVAVGCVSPNFKNSRKGHWVVSKSISAQRLATMAVLATIEVHEVERAIGGTPNHIHFVRLGPGICDDDSAPVTIAAVRDQVCAWLAHDNTPTGKGDDGPKCGIKFTYQQQRQKPHGVRIELRRES